MLAPDKHTPTYPASSAPDTRSRRALPKPCNVGPDAAAPPPRPRRHRAHPNARHPRPPDPGPRTSPPQRWLAPARHRTVPRPTAWGARASTKQSAPAPRSRNRPPNGANRSPGRRRPAGTPEPPPAPARRHQPPPSPRSPHWPFSATDCDENRPLNSAAMRSRPSRPPHAPRAPASGLTPPFHLARTPSRTHCTN